MFSRPNILVATDFSEASEHALRAAEKLRKISNGKICVIHSTPYPGQWDWPTNDVTFSYHGSDEKKDLIAHLKHEMKEQMDQCQVEGETEVLFGPPASAILGHITEKEPDLVVLGHRERGNILHLGSVAGKVMSGSSVPVLIANKDLEVSRIAGLVDPYKADKNVFSVSEELAYLCSSGLEFVSVCGDSAMMVEQSMPDSSMVVQMNDERKKLIKEWMESILKSNSDPHTAATFRTEVSRRGSVDELVRILGEDGVQLAVMTRHQKGALEKFFLGSVTKGVLNHWRGNLLVLPSNKDGL